MPATPASWTPETVFRPGARVGAAGQGGRTVLLDYAAGRYFGLDEVGTSIWELLRDGATLQRIVDALGAEYDAPLPVLRDDAAALLGQLAVQGLVVAEGAR